MLGLFLVLGRIVSGAGDSGVNTTDKVPVPKDSHIRDLVTRWGEEKAERMITSKCLVGKRWCLYHLSK